FLETQKEIIISATVAGRVLERLKADSPAFKEVFEKRFGQASDREQVAALQAMLAVYSRSGATGGLLGASDIGDSYIINIAANFNRPDLAALLANTVADQYIQRYWEMERSDASSQSQFLNTQAEQARADLQKAEEALRQYEEANSRDLAEILNDEKGGVRVYAQLTEFEAQVGRLDADIARQERVLNELIKRQEYVRELVQHPENLTETDERDLSRKLFLPPDAAIENPSLTTSMNRLNELRLQLMSLQSKFTEEYRPLQDVRDQIKEALTIVADLLEQDLAARETKRVATVEERDSLKKEIGTYQERLKRLAEQKYQYSALTRAVAVADQIYRTRIDEHERARLATNLRPEDQANIRVLDPALAPIAPTRPNKKLNMALGLVLGLALAFGMAFLVDSWDHSIKTVYDAERRLEIPVIAAISKQRTDP
ncbi:MAG: hypothetical protein NTW86_18105, partial [Candidatus Sumerlaeota bacterium]|nr:hypothetical protein [Candidatus Sumerlaeota bacterium]